MIIDGITYPVKKENDLYKVEIDSKNKDLIGEKNVEIKKDI